MLALCSLPHQFNAFEETAGMPPCAGLPARLLLDQNYHSGGASAVGLQLCDVRALTSIDSTGASVGMVRTCWFVRMSNALHNVSAGHQQQRQQAGVHSPAGRR